MMMLVCFSLFLNLKSDIKNEFLMGEIRVLIQFQIITEKVFSTDL